MNELVRVNRQVNQSISPQEDGYYRGLYDRWQVNVSKGDCEDYALQKQKLLLEAGWASSDIRIAIVTTSRARPHAVLVVRLGEIDYVLDNLSGQIKPWHKTGYRFDAIQSEADPASWQKIAPPLFS